MKKRNQQKGFTLLEIIIVIIIIGVLASLALPKLFRTVEYTKSAEALTNLGSIREAVERCAVATSVMANCTIDTLDLANPNSTTSRFTYSFAAPTDSTNYSIRAVRQTGVGNDCAVAANCGGTISLISVNGTIARVGLGIYSGIK